MLRNNKLKIAFIFTLILCSGALAENIKYAQTGFQFLSVPADARSAALAEAVTSLEMNSRSSFANPACLGFMGKTVDITLSSNTWIADIVHNNFSVSFNPLGGRYGTVGMTFRSVNYGEIQGAAVSSSDPDGYILTNIITPTANAIGFSYAKKLNDRFAVGGQISRATMDFGNMEISASETGDSTTFVSYSKSPIAIDFGTIYAMGIESLQFGMSVRNFSGEVKYENEGFQLPLAFTLGFSADVMDFTPLKKSQSLIVSIDATHFRERPEQIKVGLEYTLMNFLALRGGYVSNSDENTFSFGIGVSKFGFGFDYAYVPFESFDAVQMMTLSFEF